MAVDYSENKPAEPYFIRRWELSEFGPRPLNCSNRSFPDDL